MFKIKRYKMTNKNKIKTLLLLSLSLSMFGCDNNVKQEQETVKEYKEIYTWDDVDSATKAKIQASYEKGRAIYEARQKALHTDSVQTR